MESLLDTGREFLGLTVEVLPLLLLGAVAGAALEAFLGAGRAGRLLASRSHVAVPGAVAAGALLPGCSCATMPMAAAIAQGTRARVGTVAAFIFASPLLSPITVALTWAMLGAEMTVARTAAALAGALLLGVGLNALVDRRRAAARPTLPVRIAGGAPDACEPGCGAGGRESGRLLEKLRRLPLRSLQILRGVLPYFVVGMAIAAAISVAVPEGDLAGFLGGSSGALAYLLAALVGIPIYVCEGEEVPITYGLVQAGLGPGPSLTFLLGSVGTCVPTILMSGRVIGRQATAIYLGFWFPFAIGAGLLFQLWIAG